MRDLQDWDIAELVAFVCTAEQGSFAAAARQVGRDASVLSRRLDALEGRLYVRLLSRTNRRVMLTEAGQVFLTRARAILGELRDARDEVSTLSSGEPSGTLRLALPSTFGRVWITPALPELQARYPKLRIDCELSNRFVDLVAEGFDAAIRVGQLTSSTLVARKLAPQHRIFCASPSYVKERGTPKRLDDLASHDLLTFRGSTTFPVWRLVNKKGEEATVRPEARFVTDDAEALRDAALGGLGIMMTADWLVGRELGEGRLVRVLPNWTTAGQSAIYSVVASGRLVPRKTRAFLDWAATRFAKPPWHSKT